MTYRREPDGRLTVETYWLPAHWASALINGDESGMSDEESAALADWLACRKHLGACIDCSEESEFRHSHDDGMPSGNFLEYSFPVLSCL